MALIKVFQAGPGPHEAFQSQNFPPTEATGFVEAQSWEEADVVILPPGWPVPEDNTKPIVNAEPGVHLGQAVMNKVQIAFLTRPRPQISVITPVYWGTTQDYLTRAYESIRGQESACSWEWVIFQDGSCDHLEYPDDARIRIYGRPSRSQGSIGLVKSEAFSLGRGHLLLELDHDDAVNPQCFTLLNAAARRFPEAGMFYSDTVEKGREPYREGFALGYGRYSKENPERVIANPITPRSIRHIVGSPNHLRAWRREVYQSIGGHCPHLRVCDDYELIIRTFLNSRICYVGGGDLYIQHCEHSTHRNLDANREIQRLVRTISYAYDDLIAERFTELGLTDYVYKQAREHGVCSFDYILGTGLPTGQEQDCTLNFQALREARR